MSPTKTVLRKISKDPSGVLKTLTIDEIEEIVQYANYLYYTKGDPFFTDDIYDIVKEHLRSLDPKNPILKHVGAVLTDDDRKEKLPFYMGSMDKIKADERDLSNFTKTYPGEYVISDKLDGVSGLFYKGKLYTRGDGEYGQNITHLIPFIKGFPGQISDDIAVRGELIMNKKDFETNKAKGANARNMVAGLLNAKTPDLSLLKSVHFVSYNVYHPILQIDQQYKTLEASGFETVFNIKTKDISFENLTKILVDRRSKSHYDIDGVIVSHNATYKVISGQNPKYAFAFKNMITNETAEVIVTNVEWNLSKDSYFKPVVEFEGVRLGGVMIKRATAFNAEFVKSNVIGPGSRILLVRSGDVIPHVKSVLSQSASGEPQFPEDDYKWNETGKDILAVEERDEVKLKLLESFFKKLKVSSVGPGTVKKLYEAGNDSIDKILLLTITDIAKIQGFQEKSASKIVENIQASLKELDCVTLMAASNKFGRGFGERRLKSIFTAIPNIVNNYEPTMDEMLKIEGVSNITAVAFIKGLKEFNEFKKKLSAFTPACRDNGKDADNIKKKRDEIPDEPKTSSKKKRDDVSDELPETSSKKKRDEPETSSKVKFTGQIIVFTGFRDKKWEAIIESNGGKVSTSVSGKTTLVVCKDVSDDSGKIKEAKAKGITVMSREDFQQHYNI